MLEQSTLLLSQNAVGAAGEGVEVGASVGALVGAPVGYGVGCFVGANAPPYGIGARRKFRKFLGWT
jgi:hypothetical protein